MPNFQIIFKKNVSVVPGYYTKMFTLILLCLDQLNYSVFSSMEQCFQTTFINNFAQFVRSPYHCNIVQMCEEYFPLSINQIVDAEGYSSVNTKLISTSTLRILDTLSQNPSRTEVSSQPRPISSKRLFPTPRKTRKQTSLSEKNDKRYT